MRRIPSKRDKRDLDHLTDSEITTSL